MIEFVFMLTRDDVTVADAPEVLASAARQRACATSASRTSGRRRRCCATVTAAAHDAGMEVMLEVVSTSREDELRSLRAALDIGVDWVLGGTHAEEGAGDPGRRPRSATARSPARSRATRAC